MTVIHSRQRRLSRELYFMFDGLVEEGTWIHCPCVDCQCLCRSLNNNTDDKKVYIKNTRV